MEKRGKGKENSYCASMFRTVNDSSPSRRDEFVNLDFFLFHSHIVMFYLN